MKKRWFLALVLAAAVAGGAFAQTDFGTMPKNTVTYDYGTTLGGILLQLAADVADYGQLITPGFGFAAQYERQLLAKLSVGGRLAIVSGVFLLDETGVFTLDSASIEGHVRFYPFAKTFFLDGMLGYANVSVSPVSGYDYESDYRDYFKVGAKVGWRFSFGEPGVFTFESAIGYSYGIMLGDTEGLGFGDREFLMSLMVGGPRLTLGFGWRF